jgi:YesN/AraC family two-component response regulator
VNAPRKSGAPLRVAIADDHPIIRDGLSALLDSVDGIEVVGTASNGREAVKMAVMLRPDVLVLDIRMPDLTVWAPPGRSPRPLRRRRS